MQHSFEALDALLKRGTAGIDELLERGEMIVQYKNATRDSHVKRAVPCTLLAAPQFKARVVNASTLSSEIGNSICKDGADLAVVWSAFTPPFLLAAPPPPLSFARLYTHPPLAFAYDGRL